MFQQHTTKNSHVKCDGTIIENKDISSLLIKINMLLSFLVCNKSCVDSEWSQYTSSHMFDDYCKYFKFVCWQCMTICSKCYNYTKWIENLTSEEIDRKLIVNNLKKKISLGIFLKNLFVAMLCERASNEPN